MREMLSAYREATQSIIQLLAPGDSKVDTERLWELVSHRDSLISVQPTLQGVADDPELLAIAEEISRLDQEAQRLVAQAMERTQVKLQQMKHANLRASAYEQSYQADSYFIDKKK